MTSNLFKVIDVFYHHFHLLNYFAVVSDCWILFYESHKLLINNLLMLLHYVIDGYFIGSNSTISDCLNTTYFYTPLTNLAPHVMSFCRICNPIALFVFLFIFLFLTCFFFIVSLSLDDLNLLVNDWTGLEANILLFLMLFYKQRSIFITLLYQYKTFNKIYQLKLSISF